MNNNSKNDLSLSRWNKRIAPLEKREKQLSTVNDDHFNRYAGLIHLDKRFEQIHLNFAITLTILESRTIDPDAQYQAKRRAMKGLELLDRLQKERISLDQQQDFRDSPEMIGVLGVLEHLLMNYGASLFEVTEQDTDQEVEVAKILRASLEKYGTSPNLEDRRRIEIEPGDEQIIHSDTLVMPISQAILFIEEEILPELHRELNNSPGSPEIQQRIGAFEQELESLKQTELTPRSIPLFPDKVTYLEGITGFGDNGEPLIKMKIPVSFSSKNRLDRILLEVKNDLIRHIANKGFSKKIDLHYKQKRALKSGRSGSFQFPADKVNTEKMFSHLSFQFPFLRRLENLTDFQNLISYVEHNDRERLEGTIEQWRSRHRNVLLNSPGFSALLP